MSTAAFGDSRAAEDPFYFVGASSTPRDDVVEIARGVGRLTRAIAREARSVSALHVSERMLGRARECDPELENVTLAAFQSSNDSHVHEGRGSVAHPEALHPAAADGSTQLERVVGEGTQWCVVLTRRM